MCQHSFKYFLLINVVCFHAGYSDGHIWVGGRFDSTSNEFKWSNKEKIDPSLFAAGEPNDSGDTCAFTYRDRPLLYDGHCRSHLGYACQKCTKVL